MIEMVTGLGALLVTTRPYLLMLAYWKLGTELLYPIAGRAVDIWEWVERGGDYVAPFALLAVLQLLQSPVQPPSGAVPVRRRASRFREVWADSRLSANRRTRRSAGEHDDAARLGNHGAVVRPVEPHEGHGSLLLQVDHRQARAGDDVRALVRGVASQQCGRPAGAACRGARLQLSAA